MCIKAVSVGSSPTVSAKFVVQGGGAPVFPGNRFDSLFIRLEARIRFESEWLQFILSGSCDRPSRSLPQSGSKNAQHYLGEGKVVIREVWNFEKPVRLRPP